MKIWGLRLSPHCNHQTRCPKAWPFIPPLHPQSESPENFYLFLRAQGWGGRALLLIKLRGSTDHAGGWWTVDTCGGWTEPKVLTRHGSEKPGITIHKKPRVQRQSCILTRHLWALPLTLLFSDLGNTPLLLPFFLHGNPYSPHPAGNRVMIPTSQLQKVKMCSAPHLLRLSTSSPCLFTISTSCLVQPMEEGSAAGTLTWRRSEEWGGEGEEESGYSEKPLFFVYWNLAQKKKNQYWLSVENRKLFIWITFRLTGERIFSITNRVYILYIHFKGNI